MHNYVQREMTKFKVLAEREHTTLNFAFSPWTATLSLQIQLLDSSATLDILKESDKRRRSLKVCGNFKVAFFFALPL